MQTDHQTQRLLEQLRLICKTVLADNLVGIYIHGSLALGSYRFDVSDLDYLIVVDHAPLLSTKIQLLAETMTALQPLAPAKGLEFHVMTLQETRFGTHPYHFELHYSPMPQATYNRDPSGYASRMHGADPDLAVHIKIIKAHGIVLSGSPIASVFNRVSDAAYLQSVMADIDDAPVAILQSPMYTILNLCRTLAYLFDGKILSKRGGGEWALEQLPDLDLECVQVALTWYTGNSVQTIWPSNDRLVNFAENMLQLIYSREKSNSGETN